MIFKSFIRAIFIASLENKRISSLVGNDENTVNSAGSRPHDKGGGGGGGGGCHPNWSNLYYGLPLHNGHSFARQSIY